MQTPVSAQPPSKSSLETRVCAHLDAGRLDAACTVLLEALGPEIGAYLTQVAESAYQGSEAFSAFAEDIWRGLPGFRFESSLRTWCYVIARRALARERRNAQRQRKRQLPLSALGPVSRIAAAIRDQTATWRKTAMKEKIQALREQLEPQEQELLILRIDRQLSFKTIAQMMSVEDLTESEEKKQAATLRKRFERLKAHIRDLAVQEGLL